MTYPSHFAPRGFTRRDRRAAFLIHQPGVVTGPAVLFVMAAKRVSSFCRRSAMFLYSGQLWTERSKCDFVPSFRYRMGRFLYYEVGYAHALTHLVVLPSNPQSKTQMAISSKMRSVMASECSISSDRMMVMGGCSREAFILIFAPARYFALTFKLCRKSIYKMSPRVYRQL